MKDEIPGKPRYRKVLADLHECEEHYSGLVKSIGSPGDSALAFALEALKSEVRRRRRLEAELLTAVEMERQRLGQDLHDDLCQRLGALALMAGALAKRVHQKDEKLGTELDQIPKLINATISSCRDMARGLHPVTLAADGLPAALEELATGLPLGVKFSWPHGKRIELERETALHLYRIAEEAVGNAVKHSQAQAITVELSVVAGRPVLVISDDGKGFGKQSNTKGMGLRNMQYRANVIDAELRIEPGESGGTRVWCKLPRNRGNA